MNIHLNSVLRSVLPGITLALSLSILPTFSAQAESTAAQFNSQTILLKGQQVPSLLNRNFNEIALVRLDEQGKLKNIPLQIDDMNVEGTPYIPALSMVAVDGSIEKVDPNDEVLFMARDGGRKAEADVFNYLEEIEYHHRRKTYYVYLIERTEFPNLAYTQNSYVEYLEDEARFTSNRYSLSTDRDNPLQWRDLTYNNYNGSKSTSLLDTMKVRISAGVVTSFPRITITNNNMNAKVIDIIKGPIRTMVQTEATVVTMKVPVMKIHTLFVGYESQMDTVVRAEIPRVFGKLMKNPEITLSLDGNELGDSTVYSANKPDSPILVDGKMSKLEKSIAKSTFADDNWWWLSTGKNFDWIINLVPGKQFSPELSPYYVDDRREKDKPERFRGQWPNMGYKLTGIDANQVINFTIQIFFTNGNQEMDLPSRQYLGQVLHQPDTKLTPTSSLSDQPDTTQEVGISSL